MNITPETPPYLQRVMTEKQDLDTKIAALTRFIQGDLWTIIDAHEQSRLLRQHAAMSEYSRILGERIKA